jgi:hypothetical protein
MRKNSVSLSFINQTNLWLKNKEDLNIQITLIQIISNQIKSNHIKSNHIKSNQNKSNKKTEPKQTMQIKQTSKAAAQVRK